MAMSSRNARASAIGFLVPILAILPAPSGSISAADRQQTAYSYAGLGSAPSVTVSAGGKRPQAEPYWRWEQTVTGRGTCRARAAQCAGSVVVDRPVVPEPVPERPSVPAVAVSAPVAVVETAEAQIQARMAALEQRMAALEDDLATWMLLL
jgi:hypothetical protein